MGGGVTGSRVILGDKHVPGGRVPETARGGTSRLSPPGPAPGHTRAGGQKEEVLALRAWVTWREQEGKGREGDRPPSPPQEISKRE